jgi:hypothetical protein
MTQENQDNNIDIQLNATLTCPECETQQKVVMPEHQFQHYYKCTNEECLEDLSPLEEKDCVFCSYSDTVCPQRQVEPKATQEKLHSLI